jgi:uncharacterized protein (DUF302 family)
MSDELAFTVRMKSNFNEAHERVVGALKQQGFGVLTQIDVQATMKEKLGVEFRPYVILGACNPPLAHRALSSERRVGIMLPCNVTIEEDKDGVIVSLANPSGMLTAGDLGQSDELQSVAIEARQRIMAVADALSNAG